MRHTLDWPIVIAYLLAAVISCTVLFSISPERLTQQIISFAIGIGLVIYLSRQEPGLYASLGWAAYGVTILMLIATYILGENVRGSVRWITIGGFQFQGSEFTKPFLIVAFTQFFTQFPLKNIKNVAINIGLFIVPVLLIFKQPDLGTALVVSAIWCTQLLVAGSTWWVPAGLAVSAALGGFAIPHILHDYQLKRLTSFLDPAVDPLGSGYNVIQSVIAVGSGKIFGKGLGHGTQSHLRFLPERHTDFIFASLAEELGLVGALAVILVLAYLMYHILSYMLRGISREFRLIMAGTFAFLCFQTVINIGMNMGIAPVTGITLPLISYGGSSIIATSIALGMVSSIIRNAPPDPSIEIK
jgi:rod shape determining protein RodA